MTQPDAKGVAIYHRMYAREDFITTAGILWVLVRETARRHPGVPRLLYLDIDGHGRKNYDAQASEVVSFTRAALGPFVTRSPWGKTDESAGQSEELPDAIITTGNDGQVRILTGDRDEPVSHQGWHPAGREEGVTTCVVYVRTHGKIREERS